MYVYILAIHGWIYMCIYEHIDLYIYMYIHNDHDMYIVGITFLFVRSQSKTGGRNEARISSPHSTP